MRRGSITHALVRKHHMFCLFDACDRLHVGVHQFVGNVYDARRPEDIPVGVEGGGAGEAGGIGEGEGGFEAVAGDDGKDVAGAI